MIDDPEELNRRAAYLDVIRHLARTPRMIGFLCCLVGVLGLAFAAYRLGDPLAPLGLASLIVIAIGWALFAYAIVVRTRYVRAHPFNPKT